jgi:hypothetical protein
MDYGFRLRFRLPNGEYIKCEEPRSNIHLSRYHSLVLHPSDNLRLSQTNSRHKSLCDADDLSIVGTTFGSSEEAQRAGDEMLQVLRLAYVLLGSGIDTGTSGAIGVGPRIESFTSKGALERQAVALGLYKHAFIEDQLGVTIFQGSQPLLSSIEFSFSSRLDTPLSRVIDAVSNAESLTHRLSSRIALASELYSSTHFETSLRARFLTLMTAVEVLSDPEKPKKDIDKGTALLVRVIPICVQSKYRQAWDDCYTARCALIHEGRTTEPLGQLFTELDHLVRALVVYELGMQVSFLPWDVQ